MRARGRSAGLCCFGLVAVVMMSGCGNDSSDSALTRANAQVAAKERALTQAQADFKSASSEFCGAAKTYITGLDRYADILHTTAVTVGDVRDAGSDLVSPREDAMTAAESAVEANQAVLDAKNELADARAELASVQSSTASSKGPDATSPVSSATAKPLVPAATTSRVRAAESDFDAAVRGITDQTPLVRASQEFNAAAVALEMSWLQLFAEAGCLTDEQQARAETAVRDYTTALQSSLRKAGYFKGEVDGVYGPTTVDAVKSLQQAHGLPVTGAVDKATEAALQGDLQAAGGAAAQASVASTAALQQTLALTGFWDGPVDGNWTPELTSALKSFQEELGVKPTGAVDAATVAAFEAAIEAAQEPPSATPSTPSASAEPSETGSTAG